MVLIVRSVMAVIAGLIVAFVLVAAGELLGQRIFPWSRDVDLSSSDAIRVAMGQWRLPTGALATVVASWGIEVIVGSFLGASLGPRAKLTNGMVLGAIFLPATIGNLLLLPHPLGIWFWGSLRFFQRLASDHGWPKLLGRQRNRYENGLGSMKKCSRPGRTEEAAPTHRGCNVRHAGRLV
jgi:hypothetical protein